MSKSSSIAGKSYGALRDLAQSAEAIRAMSRACSCEAASAILAIMGDKNAEIRNRLLAAVARGASDSVKFHLGKLVPRAASAVDFLAVAEALLVLGDVAGAVAATHRVISSPSVNNDNLKACLSLAGRAANVELLEAGLRKLIEREPCVSKWKLDLGLVFHDRRMYGQGAEILAPLVNDPACGDVHAFILGVCLRELGRFDEARIAFAKAGDRGFDRGSSRLLVELCDERQTGPGIAAVHREWASRQLPDDSPRLPRCTRAERRLRIGYLSQEMRLSSVGFFIYSVLHHPPESCDVFVYDATPAPDHSARHLRSSPSTWREIRAIDDRAAADLIRSDDIDILVEVSGPCQMHRLGILAHRPARVNVSYLGYPAPTGIRQFDFRLTDRNCVPSAANRFTGPEAVYAMNGPFFCYSADFAPPIAPTPSLASRHITFGLFTTLKKIRPMMISLYARILRQVPHSRLLIKAPGADDPIVQRALLGQFASAGTDPNRIEFQGESLFQHYLLDHARIDIMLDTFPFNGHTTSCHCLHMGVPLVSRIGDLQHSRLSLATLAPMDLPQWCAATDDQFVETAVSLAADIEQLNRTRLSLRDRMRASPIMNPARMANDLADAYRTMLQLIDESELDSPR